MALTEAQEKWFASIKANLEAETGKSFADWVALARGCPETAHRARLKWMKDTYGFGMNRASVLLAEAFPSALHWSEPDALLDHLWPDPGLRAIYDAVADQVSDLPDIIVGARRTFVGFSRKVQFAAIKPAKGAALLGLDVPPEADPRLQPARKEGWSERLKSTLRLTAPDQADEALAALLRQAWERAG
jgi:hypothetical protein